MRELRVVRTLDVADAVAEASRLFRERAAAAGLIDVAYAAVDSPIGELLVAATKRGLVRVSFPTEAPDDVVEELAALLSPRVLEAPARLDEIRRELDEYFDGSRTHFEVPVDMALTRGFTRKVLQATARIPFGSVSTYRDVARKAGNERAYRAAGNALGANPIPIVVPCHRVLHSGGGLGGYGGGLDVKRYLLQLEHAI
ncbi:MAG: methylated-DNA--[protein]-cysteine S-methyltransferase [Actinomycetota bacterium]